MMNARLQERSTKWKSVVADVFVRISIVVLIIVCGHLVAAVADYLIAG